MVHLIDKDQIVSEIEKLMYAANTEADIASTGECFNEDIANAKYKLCEHILGVIGTFEVKEVDLKKEFSQWWKGERAKDYNVDILYERYSNVSMKLAKHFFELGLNASNPIAEENLESFVRQVIDLDIEAGEHYNNIIKEERKENGGSDLMINLLSGTIDAKELGIQYVLNKLKTQKGEEV